MSCTVRGLILMLGVKNKWSIQDIMKRPIQSILLACVIALVFTGCASTKGHSSIWEYKVIVATSGAVQLEREINKAATEGWEFVATSSYGEAMPLAVFRRPKK